jgi:hypothetical protein
MVPKTVHQKVVSTWLRYCNFPEPHLTAPNPNKKGTILYQMLVWFLTYILESTYINLFAKNMEFFVAGYG